MRIKEDEDENANQRNMGRVHRKVREEGRARRDEARRDEAINNNQLPHAKVTLNSGSTCLVGVKSKQTIKGSSLLSIGRVQSRTRTTNTTPTQSLQNANVTGHTPEKKECFTHQVPPDTAPAHYHYAPPPASTDPHASDKNHQWTPPGYSVLPSLAVFPQAL